jgi:hypothetical protein
MPRTATNGSIDDILRAAMEPVLRRASTAIARALAEAAAEHIDGELQRGLSRTRGRRGARAGATRTSRPARRERPPAARRRADITRWVADRRARRVPTFVIDMTNGLDTKKKIVAKFGEDAVFEKGKPLPKPR